MFDVQYKLLIELALIADYRQRDQFNKQDIVIDDSENTC